MHLPQSLCRIAHSEKNDYAYARHNACRASQGPEPDLLKKTWVEDAIEQRSHSKLGYRERQNPEQKTERIEQTGHLDRLLF